MAFQILQFLLRYIVRLFFFLIWLMCESNRGDFDYKEKHTYTAWAGPFS